MSLDSIIGIVIVPAIFLWLGSLIYKHEKEHIDPIIATIKGWFKKDEVGEEVSTFSGEYEIGYRGAEY